jgi:hypothetical protein
MNRQCSPLRLNIDFHASSKFGAVSKGIFGKGYRRCIIGSCRRAQQSNGLDMEAEIRVQHHRHDAE